MTCSKVLRNKIEDDDDAVDSTNDFEVFNRGKTIECDCGLGIGVELESAIVKCSRCGKYLVDLKFNEREKEAEKRIEKNEKRAEVNSEKQEQTTLSNW